MRSLKVNYKDQFEGVEEKPKSYHELADKFEWAKRDVDQDMEGHIYNECNGFLDFHLANQVDKVIVECGCGLGRNLHRYSRENKCIGVDFSSTGLQKIRLFETGTKPLKSDIRHVALETGSADFVIFSNVLFIYEDLNEVLKMLKEAHRILKENGKIIVINDYCSVAVRLSQLFQIPQAWFTNTHNDSKDKQFMLYYYSKAESKRLLELAGFTGCDSHLCNSHLGVYHVTYLNLLACLFLRGHRRHNEVRRMDHWERVRKSNSVNGAYPLSPLGRLVAAVSNRFFPSLASLSVCFSASKTVN